MKRQKNLIQTKTPQTSERGLSETDIHSILHKISK